MENVKEQKLNEYRDVLDSQKIGFLESKLAAMKAIVEEETAFGVVPSFTEEEMKGIQETLRLRKEEEEQKHPTIEIEKEVY